MAPEVAFVRPTDPPQGSRRLLDRLRKLLGDAQIRRLRIVVAFAKVGPLLRLQADLRKFRARGGRIEAVIGVDACGTSKQALEFAMAEFDAVAIWHHPSPAVTFHPKMYFADGSSRGICVVGSQNLTGGGTETNAEAAVELSYDLATEAAAWSVAEQSWSEVVASPNYSALNQALLSNLDGLGLLLDEATARGTRGGAGKAIGGVGNLFPWSPVVPPSPRPSKAAQAAAAQPARSRLAPVSVPALRAPPLPRALLIQIVPHHNGEVFLSKLAVNEHPEFFGYPFLGTTTPKKPGNAAYPQRVPDPITDWVVRDSQGVVVDRLPNYALNTVYYSTKSEIRVTLPPAFAGEIEAGSLLQMTAVTGGGVDYLCEVFHPASLQFAALIPACTRSMPSGGGSLRRKYGWV